MRPYDQIATAITISIWLCRYPAGVKPRARTHESPTNQLEAFRAAVRAWDAGAAAPQSALRDVAALRSSGPSPRSALITLTRHAL